MAYASTNLAPAISPASTWFGAQVGLLPQFDYGSSGVKFGGLEAGFDTISPYGRGIVKPVLNLKLGAVTEGKISPSVAAGIMEISPALPSMNFLYLASTKKLQFGAGPSFGRLTLGLGYSAGARAIFNGTLPFYDTRLALMAAYESPMIAERVGFIVDHFGGTSEVSGTYLGAMLCISDSTMIGAGAFLANERSEPGSTYDGFYGMVSSTFDVFKLFSTSP